jgi:hypothetical protein
MQKVIALLALACVVSPSVAKKVRVDFDHESNFSGYRTYRWMQSPDAKLHPGQLPNAQFPNQLMRERIVGFIEEALAAKGLRRVDTAADLVVDYQMKVTEQQQLTTYTDGLGWGWGWGSAVSTTTTQTIRIGTLVVSMVDPRHEQLIFQGMSSDTISSKPTENTKKFAKAINKIFQKYPPKS